jgi:hypothetical protein
MADNYVWLDDERNHAEIYAFEQHWRCACHWEPVLDGPISNEREPALRLIGRLRRCPIHGEKGWI